MTTLRRLVLFLLLFTVPLQEAVGATGYVCGRGAHHARTSAIAGEDEATTRVHPHGAVLHEHRSSPAGHSHGAQGSTSDAANSGADAVQPMLAHPQSGERSSADTCEFCSECGFSLAPLSDTTPNIIRPASSSRDSFYVDPATVPHVGDALFRPPRSIRSA